MCTCRITTHQYKESIDIPDPSIYDNLVGFAESAEVIVPIFAGLRAFVVTNSACIGIKRILALIV